MAGQTKGRYKDSAINIYVNSCHICLPCDTNPIPKFNSAANVASESSNGPRSMNQGLAIVNRGGKQENGNF